MYAHSIRNIQVISSNRANRANRVIRVNRTGRHTAVLERPEAWNRTGVCSPHVRRMEETAGRSVKARSVAPSRASVLRMALFGLLLGCSLFFGVLYTRASAAEAAEDYKYYTDITVAYGEDFMDYAAQYADTAHYPEIRDYLREVCAINNLTYREDMTNLKVHPGDTLIVPYYSQAKLP